MAKPTLTPAERIRATLDHQEPDRVPLDFSATGLSGLRVEAQDALLRHIEIDDISRVVVNAQERLAQPHEALLELYPADATGWLPTPGPLVLEDDDGEERYDWLPAVHEEADPRGAELPRIPVRRLTDEWGVVWERRGPEHAFHPQTVPLSGELPSNSVAAHDFPDPTDERRWAAAPDIDERPTIIGGYGRGLLETALLLRGRQDVNRDLALDTGLTQPIIERTLDVKMRYWEARLAGLDEAPALLVERERFDLLDGLPMGESTFRQLLRPHWEQLAALLQSLAPDSAIMLFASVYSHRYLQDLVDMGFGAVNTLPAGIVGANAAFMKREYGDSIVFWGGGSWSKADFLMASPDKAADHVKATLDEMAPGGGFVWAPSPVIDVDVPPENVVSALDTLFEYGLY
ncbi:hypothetical protein CMK11_17105 [Candidatus Poribacteria bacterium]|nr:hypothetical protein [Candidatus Poribacteria bacterium]